jgi:hypothetical protein
LAIQTYHDYSHPQHRFMQQNPALSKKNYVQ